MPSFFSWRPDRDCLRAFFSKIIAMASVIRLPPFHYVHINDQNELCVRLVVGPRVVTLREHEKPLSSDPIPMIVVPPQSYCLIRNPVVREEGEPQTDEYGNFVLQYGRSEVRFHQEPFPLFPGEELALAVTPLRVVPPNSALRIRCLQDFVSDDGTRRIAGDEWLFRGPATYIPHAEEAASSSLVESLIILPETALRLRARRDGIFNNVKRYSGEVWLHDQVGAYLPDVDEHVEGIERAEIITPESALHLAAIVSHTDRFNVLRKAGQEWLITSDVCTSYIPEVSQRRIGSRPITVLNDMQYCVILDPVDEQGIPRFGEKLLKRGPERFFLRPGERLQGSGCSNVEVLEEGQALLLEAQDIFTDAFVQPPIERLPGQQWMIFGPGEYVPPVDVVIRERRSRIPLDEHEGIYVRDRTGGSIRAVMGPQSYMLQTNEERWSKTVPAVVDALLTRTTGKPRDPTRVITLRTAHNTAVQVYNYRAGTSRVVFGPNLIALGPEEDFTMLSLSGGKPKTSHQIKDIALQLGPDFMTDHVVVETADHAKLQLILSYNWQFLMPTKESGAQEAASLFSVPDFVGDGCMAIASRVRAAVASVPFDEFHKNSARIIRDAVFVSSEAGTSAAPASELYFPANRLLVTNVDIKAVDPVDQRTREMLQQSVQLAIDITTQSVQLEAQHKAQREEQAAKGDLGNLRIQDQTAVEQQKRELIALRGECLMAQRIGQAVAEASAKTEAGSIVAKTEVDASNLRAKAASHRYSAALDALLDKNAAEHEYQQKLNKINLAKARSLAEVEAEKFEKIVSAIGPETIADIARAGPEMQAKLLAGLGIESFLITDGNSPINLFNTASSLVQNSNLLK